MSVHENKMVQMIDDRMIFEQSRDMLRMDIRGFENLCQDLSKFNKDECLRLEAKMDKKFMETLHELDLIKDGQERQSMIIDN